MCCEEGKTVTVKLLRIDLATYTNLELACALKRSHLVVGMAILLHNYQMMCFVVCADPPNVFDFIHSSQL